LTAAVHPAVLDTDVASLLHRRKLTAAVPMMVTAAASAAAGRRGVLR
jgi:hypothetical protein